MQNQELWMHILTVGLLYLSCMFSIQELIPQVFTFTTYPRAFWVFFLINYYLFFYFYFKNLCTLNPTHLQVAHAVYICSPLRHFPRIWLMVRGDDWILLAIDAGISNTALVNASLQMPFRSIPINRPWESRNVSSDFRPALIRIGLTLVKSIIQ